MMNGVEKEVSCRPRIMVLSLIVFMSREFELYSSLFGVAHTIIFYLWVGEWNFLLVVVLNMEKQYNIGVGRLQDFISGGLSPNWKVGNMPREVITHRSSKMLRRFV